ncbi:2743_t:CDS:1, partial [Gigaspora margarita]
MTKIKKFEYYKRLSLKCNATLLEIKHAYRKLVIIYHPDKNVNKSEDERLVAEKKFKEIQEAYEFLTNNFKEKKKKTLQKKSANPKKSTKPQNKKNTKSKNNSKSIGKTPKITKEFKEIFQEA